MYEIDAKFREYFNELDPAKRLELLDALTDDEDTQLLRRLYSERYIKEKDHWLWRAICLQMLYGQWRLFKSSRNKEARGILRELHTEDDNCFLYHEYRNVARRYLSTCKCSGYASSLMGLKTASDDEKIIKACLDIWQMSEGIARQENLRDNMKLWIKAFYDELVNYSSICRQEYERLCKHYISPSY